MKDEAPRSGLVLCKRSLKIPWPSKTSHSSSSSPNNLAHPRPHHLREGHLSDTIISQIWNAEATREPLVVILAQYKDPWKPCLKFEQHALCTHCFEKLPSRPQNLGPELVVTWYSFIQELKIVSVSKSVDKDSWVRAHCGLAGDHHYYHLLKYFLRLSISFYLIVLYSIYLVFSVPV